MTSAYISSALSISAHKRASKRDWGTLYSDSIEEITYIWTHINTECSGIQVAVHSLLHSSAVEEIQKLVRSEANSRGPCDSGFTDVRCRASAAGMAIALQTFRNNKRKHQVTTTTMCTKTYESTHYHNSVHVFSFPCS